MMHALRQNTKIILWIVVIAFIVTIFAVWGLDLQSGGPKAGDPNVIGRVNGVAITRQEYQYVYNNLAQQLRANSQDQDISYTQEEFIRSQAWDNLVYRIITDEQIERMQIAVTDEEIVAFLRNSPPPEIRMRFVDENGNFDNARYQAELNNPANDWTALEAIARARIPRVKLNEYLTAQVHVSEAELLRTYALEALDMEMRWVEFPFDDVDIGDWQPTDEELQTYYNEHNEDFVDPVKARVDLVRLPIEPTTADQEDALWLARRTHEKVVGGADFGDEARLMSEAPTSFVGGNTGFITRDRRVPAYFDALDGLATGKVSDVIETESGYYILKLLEKRSGESGETEYSAQEILVTSTVGRQTLDSLYDTANSIAEDAATMGFEAAATKAGIAIQRPEPFAEQGFIGEIGFSPAITRFAFSAAPGAVSSVLRDEENLYVVRLVEMIPEQPVPFEEARGRLTALVREQALRNGAQHNADAFFLKVRGSDYDTALSAYGLTAKESGLFRGTDELEGLGVASPVVEAALSIDPGNPCPPIEHRRMFVVLDLIRRAPLDPEDYRARAPDIRARLRGQKAQLYVQSWYENLKSQSEIEDFRTS